MARGDTAAMANLVGMFTGLAKERRLERQERERRTMGFGMQQWFQQAEAQRRSFEMERAAKIEESARISKSMAEAEAQIANREKLAAVLDKVKRPTPAAQALIEQDVEEIYGTYRTLSDRSSAMDTSLAAMDARNEQMRRQESAMLGMLGEQRGERYEEAQELAEKRVGAVEMQAEAAMKRAGAAEASYKLMLRRGAATKESKASLINAYRGVMNMAKPGYGITKMEEKIDPETGKIVKVPVYGFRPGDPEAYDAAKNKLAELGIGEATGRGGEGEPYFPPYSAPSEIYLEQLFKTAEGGGAGAKAAYGKIQLLKKRNLIPAGVEGEAATERPGLGTRKHAGEWIKHWTR